MELTCLLLKDLKNSKFQLISEYVYRTKKYIIKVPEGFITDFASVPQVFNIFIQPHGKHSPASVVHDWLYSKECNLILSRREADTIFLEILKEEKVSVIKCYIMFLTVRIFGGKYFKNKIEFEIKKQ